MVIFVSTKSLQTEVQMKLSSAIVYFRLFNAHPARYIGELDVCMSLGRPVHYSSNAQLSDCVVVISIEDMSKLCDNAVFGSSLFVCVDEGGEASEINAPQGCGLVVLCDKLSQAELLNEIQEIFNTFDLWDEQLKETCYEVGDFQKLIDCCDPIICDPLSISDHMFYYIAYSEALSRERGLVSAFVEENRKVPLQVVSDSIIDQKFLSLYDVEEVFITAPIGNISGDVMVKNLFGRGQYVGRICIKLGDDNHYRIKFNESIINHVHFYVEKLYNKYMSFNKTENSLSGLRRLLVTYLDDGITGDDRWSRALAESGWESSDMLQLIQLRPTLRYDKNMYGRYFCMEIERQWYGCACVEYRGSLLLLLNLNKYKTSNTQDFQQSLAQFLRDNLLYAGSSRVFSDVSRLPSAFMQTDMALKIGSAKSTTVWFHRFDDYALDYMIDSCVGDMDIEMVCSEKLLKLREHDRAKNTEYLKTLDMFFKCRFNSSEAAKRLFIQRSTFFYRMDRIQKLADINFDSPEMLLYLAISLYIICGDTADGI